LGAMVGGHGWGPPCAVVVLCGVVVLGVVVAVGGWGWLLGPLLGLLGHVWG